MPRLKIKNNFAGYSSSIILVATLFLFSIIASSVNKLALSQGLLFFIFQVLGICLPGLALTLLLGFSDLDTLELIGISYAMGYSLNILEYYMLYPIGLKAFSPFLIFIIAALSIWVIAIKREILLNIKKDYISEFFCFTVFLIFLFVGFLAINMKNISPELVGNIVYQQDTPYRIENTAALARQYPPIDPRIVGYTYYYHYFTSMQIAFMQGFINISAFKLSTCFSYIEPAILLVTGIYCAFKQATKRRVLTIIAVFALMLTTGITAVTGISYPTHITSALSGFDCGIAFSLFSLYFLMKSNIVQKTGARINLRISHRRARRKQTKNNSLSEHNEGKFNPLNFIAALLMFFICCGAKTPIALVSLAAVGIICCGGLAKKNYKASFLYGIGYLAIFLIVYFFIATSPYTYDSVLISPFMIINLSNQYLSIIYAWLINVNIPSILAATACSFIWLLCNNLLVFILFLLAIILLAKNRKSIDVIDVALFISTSFGISLALIFHMGGKAQSYFIMGVYHIALLFGLRVLAKFYETVFIGRKLKAFATATTLGLLAIGTINFFSSLPKLPDGYRNYKESKMNVDSTPIQDARTISRSDYNALEWIRLNTPQDSLILADRDVIGGSMFFCGPFSERQMYMEPHYAEIPQDEIIFRKELVTGVFNNSPDAIYQAGKEGINYIVQTKWLTPEFKLPSQYGEVVYQTDTILVYQIYS